jgi:hypothetical protein
MTKISSGGSRDLGQGGLFFGGYCPPCPPPPSPLVAMYEPLQYTRITLKIFTLFKLDFFQMVSDKTITFKKEIKESPSVKPVLQSPTFGVISHHGVKDP